MTEQEVITLKEYLESRLKEMDRRWQVRSDLNDKALCSAADTLEARLTHLNEFRTQILEERALYARREDIDYKLNIIQQQLTFAKGNVAGKEWTIGVVVAILLSLGTFIFTLVKVGGLK